MCGGKVLKKFKRLVLRVMWRNGDVHVVEGLYE